MRQAQDEIKTRHLKEAEIEALQQQLNVRRLRPAAGGAAASHVRCAAQELTARKEIMKRQLDKNECYHKYLDLVIDSSDGAHRVYMCIYM